MDKKIASSFLAFPDSVHQVFLNISDDYASPVINLFNHMDSICKQSNSDHDENKHKLSFDCFSSRIYTQIQPVPQLCLDNNYVSTSLIILTNNIIYMYISEYIILGVDIT